MAVVYRGQELSLQELFSAFFYKLEEISTDPDKYVAWPDFQMDLMFTCAQLQVL